MADVVSLADGVRALVRDGDAVAMEGFTHLIPFAAGHEVLRQGRRELELIRMTPDVLYDQLVGMGAAALAGDDRADRRRARAAARRRGHPRMDDRRRGEAPGGSRPSYALGVTRRDNAFYRDWDAISRDRGRFSAWMERHVLAGLAT